MSWDTVTVDTLHALRNSDSKTVLMTGEVTRSHEFHPFLMPMCLITSGARYVCLWMLLSKLDASTPSDLGPIMSKEVLDAVRSLELTVPLFDALVGAQLLDPRDSFGSRSTRERHSSFRPLGLSGLVLGGTTLVPYMQGTNLKHRVCSLALTNPVSDIDVDRLDLRGAITYALDATEMKIIEIILLLLVPL